MQAYIPCEFNRKPRSLNDVDQWKATKFCLLLLYTGPVIFRSLIREDLYENFMVLHCAIRILTSPALCLEFTDYAEKLLHHFVQTYKDVCGAECVSHNIHNLIHLAEEVRNLGHLDGWSGFPFENFMQRLKRSTRKPGKALEQLCNRMERERDIPPRERKAASLVPIS